VLHLQTGEICLPLSATVPMEHRAAISTFASPGAAPPPSLRLPEANHPKEVRSGTTPRKRPTQEGKLLGLVQFASSLALQNGKGFSGFPMLRPEAHMNVSTSPAIRLSKSAHLQEAGASFSMGDGDGGLSPILRGRRKRTAARARAPAPHCLQFAREDGYGSPIGLFAWFCGGEG